MNRPHSITLALLLAVLLARPSRGEVLLDSIGLAASEPDLGCNFPYSQTGWGLGYAGIVPTLRGRLGDLHSGNGLLVTTVIAGATSSHYEFGEDFVCSWTSLTRFTPGSLRIFSNADGDVGFTNPGSFVDGVLLLEGTLGALEINYGEVCTTGPSSNLTATLTLTGGSLLDRFPAGQRVCTLMGTVDLDSSDAQFGCGIGYFGAFAFRLELAGSVGVESLTWGRLKRTTAQ